jgi:hypothetical protein
MQLCGTIYYSSVHGTMYIKSGLWFLCSKKADMSVLLKFVLKCCVLIA